MLTNRRYQLEILIPRENITSQHGGGVTNRNVLRNSVHIRSASVNFNSTKFAFPTSKTKRNKISYTTQSELEKEISSLKGKYRKEKTIRKTNETEISQLKNKIKILNNKENKTQTQMKNDMNTQRESLRRKQAIIKEKIMVAKSKKEKIKKMQENKKKVEVTRLSLQRNMEKTKQRYCSLKEKNGKRSVDERKKNEESIRLEKTRESSLKRETCQAVRNTLSRAHQKNVQIALKKRLLVKEGLLRKIKEEEEFNKKLGKTIIDYRSKAFDIVERINNVTIYI